MEAKNKLLKRKRKACAEGNKTLLANTCTSLGELHFSEGNFKEAIDEYEIVANAYKDLNKVMDYGRANRMISETYLQIRDYDKALHHQKIFLDIAKEQNNKVEEQRAHATFGHIYLTRYLDNIDNNPDKNCLHLAKKAFNKSLQMCERCLITVSKTERMDMTARIYSNLGILYECAGEYDKGIELLMKSINMCKQNDLFEQLERSYTFLAAMYSRKNDYSNAIHQYNLAIETGKRLENRIPLLCASLSAKADIYIKMANYIAAKDVLLKAHKLQCPNLTERELIERNLKIVASMCYTHDDLIMTNPDCYKKRKKLFEKLGDGACELKNYPKAIEYYLKMLEVAIKNNETGRELSSCYVSLAQTYKDNKEYDLAIKYFQKDFDVCKDNFKESVKTLYNIADVMDLAGKSQEEIEIIYTQAKEICIQANDLHLVGKTLKFHINFLESRHEMEKVNELKKELLMYEYADSDEESEEEHTPSIGDDIRLQDITDISDGSDTEKETIRPRTSRRRNKGLVIRKNYKGETQLHTACINGNIELVRRLIEQGHTINVRDNCGWLPLHEASIHGHLDIVQLLLDKGAAVNDRGGVHCQGVTPLHDAATNGHLEIIQLLLDRGASPLAKTDDGETPLDLLKNWKATQELHGNQNELYEKLINHMTNALLTSSDDKRMFDVKSDKKNTAFVKDNEECGDKLINNQNKYKNLPKKKQVIDTSQSNTRRKLESPSTSSKDKNFTNAAEEYKRVMENIKRPSCEIYEKKRKSFELDQQPEQSALIEVDDFDDDWLEDDLNISSTKKRKGSLADKFVTTLNMRRTSNGSKKEKSPQKQISINSSTESISSRCFEETINNQEELAYSLTGVTDLMNESGCSNTQTKNVNATNTRELQKQKSVQIGVNQSRTNFNNNKKQTIQMKLTNFSKPMSPSSVEVMEWDNFEVNKINFSNNVNQHAACNTMLSIDVKIENRFFKIPISYVDIQTKTIKWLAEVAANRYFKKECVKPTLELESKNGAVLGDDDLLSVIFPQSTLQSEVYAKVLKWNLPSLADRYNEMCSNFNEVVDPTVFKVLQEVTTTLDLSNKNLRFNKLAPVCKALNRQYNLHHLNISGNYMTRDCMLLLCSSLTSLENLSALNLSLNRLDAECLKDLSDVFLNSNKTILGNLVMLNLNYNPLGDDCLKHLAVITRHLQLHTLMLSCVDFTSNIFEHVCNKNVELYLEFVETLDISYNKLNMQSIVKIVSWLKSSKISNLNVSCNAVTEHGLLKTLVQCLSNNNDYLLNLKSINFSRCFITDSEVHELLSVLSNQKNALECLNLSYNDNLTALTLRRLLQHYPPIQRMELHGCENILKYFEDCSESIWTFVDDKRIRKVQYLSLSVDQEINKRACDILINMWRKEYFNECIIVKSHNFLLLKVP